MKRYVSVILVVAILLSLWIPAYAEDTLVYHDITSGTTTVSAKSMFEHTAGGSSDASPTYARNYFKYALNFSESGLYRLSIKNIMFNTGGTGTIYIDDIPVINGKFEQSAISGANSNSQITDFGTFSISAGKHIFKYVNGDKSIYLSSFTFEYIGLRNEYTILGSEPVSMSPAGITDNNPTTGMSANTWAEYSFKPDCEGRFGIYAEVASVAEMPADMRIDIDGTEYKKVRFVSGDTKVAGNWADFTLLYIGTVQLDATEHILKVTNLDSSMRFRRFYIKGLYEETETAFLEEMRNATNHSMVKDTLDKYSDSLTYPFNDDIEKLPYRRVFDNHLLSLPYDTYTETYSQIKELLEMEFANPLVTLTQNGELTEKLKKGEFSVHISPRFEEELTAVVGVYSDDYTSLEDYGYTQVVPYSPATISGLDALRDNQKIKIFFFKDLENIIPAEIPEIIQTQIYVSPNGDDSGSGLSLEPLATIDAAVSKAKELNSHSPRDITIFLDSGEHFVENAIVIDEEVSGNENFGLHFESLSAESPATISGGCDVEGWTDSNGDGIYEATVPNTITDVRQLYVNDMPAVRARSKDYFVADGRWDNPDNNTYGTDKDGNEVETSGFTEDGFFVTNPSFPLLTKPRDAEISYFILWTVQRLPVDDIVYDNDKSLIKMAQPSYSNALTMKCDGGIQPTIGQKFIVENDLSLLDEAGEFYFDKDTGKIYYKPFLEENMATARTVVGKTEQLFNIVGSSVESKVKNITFDNIRFRYAGYYTKVNSEGAVSFQAECLANAQAPLGHNPISTGKGRMFETNILVENADGISFENCDFSCMGATALRYGSGTTNSSVRGSIFTDIGGSALSISTWEAARPLAENIDIENNIIGRNGIDFMFCPAISIYYAKNVDVIHNTIAHTPYSAMSVGWGWAGPGNTTPVKLGVGGHNITHNRIYDISKTVIDGGHVYNLGYMTECNVTHNYLTDSPDHGGVYLDTGASNIKINNNVFERCQKYNIAYGSASSVVGNVAKDNWADKEQAKEWTGVGCSFETVEGITDGNWPVEAQEVMANAGVTEDYKGNLSRIDAPSWRTLDPHIFPETEGKIPGALFISCESYTDFYIKPNETDGKTKPSILTYSKTPGVADFRQKEWLEYKVEVPETGDYHLSIYYNKGSSGALGIFLTETPIPEDYDNMDPSLTGAYAKGCPEPVFRIYPISATGTESTAHVPHTFMETITTKDKNGKYHAEKTDTKKVFTLNKGTYYLRIFERSGGTNWSRFALTPVK